MHARAISKPDSICGNVDGVPFPSSTEGRCLNYPREQSSVGSLILGRITNEGQFPHIPIPGAAVQAAKQAVHAV